MSTAEPTRASHAEPVAGTSLVAYLFVLILGSMLGVIFVKSEVKRWERVHDMFLFREPHMYLIIGIGVLVAMVSMYLIKSLGIKSIDGNEIKYKPKPFHAGVIIGGMIFGAGWAITGACPGPIYAQIGAGEWRACVTLAGALVGMYCYAWAKPRLPH
ncbi:MAG: DUF6691 family protein [Planctomycetota bacterium]